MASIGLKVDHGSWGTDIGKALSDALTPKVSDAVSVARLKDQMLTEEYQRRLIQENITRTTGLTIAEAQEAKRKHDAWVAAGDAVGAATSRIQDSLRQNSPQTEAPVTVPDTVLQTGGRGMPEHLVPTYSYPAPTTPEAVVAAAAQPAYAAEPDFEYRVNQYPLRSDEAPEPIEIPPRGALLPPMPPRLAGVPGDLQTPPQVNVPMPEELTGVPPGLVIEPVVGSSPPVVGGSEPVIGGSEPVVGGSPPVVPSPQERPLPSWMQHLLRPIGELGQPEAPVPVESPTVADMLGGMDAPVTAPVGPVQGPPQPEIAPLDLPPPVEPVQGPPQPLRPEILTPPVTMGAEPTQVLPPLDPEVFTRVPLELQGAEPPEVIELPGRPAVSPETTAATPAVVPPATAEAPSTAAPVPSQPPVILPEPSTITVKGTGGGENDTATTVETKQGTVSREEIEAEVKAIMLSEASPEAKQQAIQRLEGDLGITYDERVNVGPTGDPNATVAAYTRAGGGASLSKDAIAAQAGKLPTGGYEGTGIEAQDHNALNAVKLLPPDAKPTAQQAHDYAQAYGRQYGTPKMQRVFMEAEGDQPAGYYDVPVPPYIPPNTPTPEEVYARADIGGAAAAAPAAAAPAVAAPAETQAVPATTAPAPATTPAPAPATTAPRPKGAVLVKPEHEIPPGEQLQNERYLNATTTADADIKTITQADLPTPAEELITNPTKYGKNWALEIANVVARSKNPKLARYWGNAMDFATAILRDESGAATRPEDMETVLERYIPRSTDSPDVIAKKALRREVAIESLRSGAFPGTNPAERLAASDKLLEEKLGKGALLNEQTKAADKAAEDEDFSKMTDEQLREELKK